MPNYWKILDYFFLLRPTLFFPLWTVTLAGKFNSDSAAPIGYIFIFLGALMGASYIINQIVDIEGDRDNNKLFLVAESYVDKRIAVILALCLIIIGIYGFFTLGWQFGLLSLLFILVTGLLYNIKPFAFKDNPFLGPMVTTFGGAAAFFFGALPTLNLHILYKVIPYLAAFGAVAFMTTIPDIEGDKQAGKKTFAVTFGFRKTILVSTLLCAFSALTAHWTDEKLIFFPALLSIPVFAFAFFKYEEKKATILAIKFAIFSLSLLAGLMYPWYLILIAAYYFFARWYYKRRFNMEYPSFKLD